MVMQGFRQTRERTNWLHRGTAVTTADSLNIEALQMHALHMQSALGCVASSFAALIVFLARHRMHPQSVARIKKVLQCLATAWLACY